MLLRPELTVKINKDAKWSDGTTVTADDVAYTFDTNVKYQSSCGSDYSAYIKASKHRSFNSFIYSKIEQLRYSSQSIKGCRISSTAVCNAKSIPSKS